MKAVPNNIALLDGELCVQLRNTINESLAFVYHEKYKPFYNLICAAMDRIDSCVNYLNLHSDYPKTEEDFICFLVFSCMLVDGVKKLLENVVKTPSKYVDEKRYFKKYCIKEPMSCTEEECPTDDRFFEHFRSLSFAHPFETSRNKVFNRKFGVQVSPWVSVGGMSSIFCHFPEPIGVKIYVEKTDEEECSTKFIMISFGDLKQYIKSRYEEIQTVTEWAKNTLETVEKEWKKTKVNRKQNTIEVLKEINAINEERFNETYTVQKIIDYLECELTDKRNTKAVAEYKKYIESNVIRLCDAVDALDYETQACIESEMMFCYPKNTHGMFNYQMEKIFGYLQEKSEMIYAGSNEEWGLIQATAFQKDLGFKWVYMNPYVMSYTEVHLLVTTACYLEMKEQMKDDSV